MHEAQVKRTSLRDAQQALPAERTSRDTQLSPSGTTQPSNYNRSLYLVLTSTYHFLNTVPSTKQTNRSTILTLQTATAKILTMCGDSRNKSSNEQNQPREELCEPAFAPG